MVRLETEKDNFLKDIEDYKKDFEKIKTFKDLKQITEYAKDSTRLEGALASAHDKVLQFNAREKLFNLAPTEYDDLKKLSLEFDPFYRLITNAADVKESTDSWKSEHLINVYYDHIASKLDQSYDQCSKLYKKLNGDDFEDAANVAIDVKKIIDAFREHLPLIKCITSEAVNDEDWNEMKEVCNQPEMDRETITVTSFEKFGLSKYLDQIEEIHTRAERKFKIQKQLHEMKANMKMTQIQLFPHKKTHVIKGYEDLNQILDEQIVATQGHLGSPFMKGKLKIETRNYETKLNLMSELIEEISKAQKNWRYLEPIFDSEDISKTMPTEANYFKDVDDLWKSTMEQIETDPGIIDLVERDNIQGMFMEANRKLDKILKSLSEFLEQKRLVFPRFYFLADSDMLMLLAQTKDP